MEADGWELATGDQEIQRSRGEQEKRSARPCRPSKGVTLGHSPCLPLVSALNGDHVCPDFAPVYRDGIQGNGGLRIFSVVQREWVGWDVHHVGPEAPSRS